MSELTNTPQTAAVKIAAREFSFYMMLFIIIWTAATIIAFWMSYSFIYSSMESVAKDQLTTFLNREDEAWRNYTALGGAYVARSSVRAVAPAFDQQDARVEGRDGKIYIHLDPEKMLYFMYSFNSQPVDDYSFRMVSTDPNTLLHRPGRWEQHAFAQVSQSNKEYFEINPINGKPFLRVLRLLLEDGQAPTNKLTGISVSMPMEPLWDKVGNKVIFLTVIYFLLFIGGIVAGLWVSNNLKRKIHERNQAQLSLLKLTEELESDLNRRTQDVYKKQLELQTFIDNLDTGVYLKNNKYEFLAVNNRLADLAHVEKADMLGRTDDWFAHPETARKIRECEQIVAASRSSYELDMVIKSGQNESTLQHVMFFPILNEGMLEGIGAILFDLSERQRMEVDLLEAKEAAERANQAKSDFLANVSHEIRTPLNGVIGMTDLLQRTPLNSDQATMVATIKHSGDNLLEVLNEILDFSKIEAGKMQLDPMPFSLRDALFEAVRSLAPAAYKKNLEIIVNIAPQAPDRLLGDVVRIRQVILNLLSNAIKFTDSGEITLTVRELEVQDEQARLRFSLTDTGIGIPYEQQKKIFDAFEQVDTSTTRKYGGTGLGLAISSKLIQLMDGTLSLESTPGHGTTFWFELTLPYLPDSASPTGIVHNYDLQKYRILLVDDNATNRKIAVGQLKEWKITAHESASADEALRFLRLAADSAKPFDLLISDMQMPDKDGMHLAQEVREDPQLQDTPIVILSSSNLTKEQLAQKLVQVIINKPVRPDDFLRAIVTALGLWESADLSHIHKKTISHPIYAIRLKILLAEDVEVNQLVASRMLRNLGHVVVTVNNGQEALEALSKQNFDLVLMDIRMPILDGVETTAIIRQREQSKNDGYHLPIVAMTAHALKGDKDKYMGSGMDAYVSKPLVQEDMVIVLNEIMERFTLASAQDKKNDAIFQMPEPQYGKPDNGEVLPASSQTSVVEREKQLTDNAALDTIDPALLEKNFGSNKDFTRETMKLYLRDADNYLGAISSAIATNSNGDLTLHAHSLKGMNSYYTKGLAYDLTVELEELGQRNGLPEKALQAQEYLQQLILATNDIKASMRQY